LPNFATYDAEGNLFVSNSSTSNINNILSELVSPSPKGALVVIRKNGTSEIVATGLYIANGTAIDPKEEAVYVSNRPATTACESR
jgi:sugar lactone lactonase YvrE